MHNTIFAAALIVALITLFLVGILTARSREKKEWNNGVCPWCGHRWRYFDTDSQGGRGYTCDHCGRDIWISYHVDKIILPKDKEL